MPHVNGYLQNQNPSYAWSVQQSSKDAIYPTHRNWALRHIKQHGKYCCFIDEFSTFDALPSDMNWSVLLYSFL